jgi:hypothetical protein
LFLASLTQDIALELERIHKLVSEFMANNERNFVAHWLACEAYRREGDLDKAVEHLLTMRNYVAELETEGFPPLYRIQYTTAQLYFLQTKFAVRTLCVAFGNLFG